tara:strand:- start:426 stop:791 length:366 start_codon:yes stop_codon:yes gene_type:complete
MKNYKKFFLIIIIIITSCKTKSKKEIFNDPDPSIRSFDFMGECINENPLLMANLAEKEVNDFLIEDIISSVGIKINDSTYNVNTTFNQKKDSVVSKKFKVILRPISCKSYKLVLITEIINN